MDEEKVLNPELEELKKQLNVLKGKVTTLESEKKKIEDEAEEIMGNAIYEKKKGLERSYGEVLKEAEQRLRVKEKEKIDERKKNLDRVIGENTKEAKESNTYLKNHIKNILKENKIPGFVDSNIYMGIWYPSTVKERVIGFIAALLVLAIPTFIVFVVSKENLIKAFPTPIFRYIIIALIYLGVIFIAGLIWLAIEKLTKKNVSALNDIKELRKNIFDNDKKIKEITVETSKEMTDDKFDYTKLDREIESCKLEVENYRKRKEEALNHFESVTVEEIKEKTKKEIDKKTKPIESEIETVKSEIDRIQKEHDELKLKLAE